MSVLNRITIAPYEQSGRLQLEEYYRRVLRQNHPLLDLQFFKWLYASQNLSGSESETYNVKLALLGDLVIGHVGFIPIDLSVRENKNLSGAWLANLSVDTQYRNSGLGKALVNKVLDEFDIVLAIGSTKEGLELHRRNNFLRVGEVLRLVQIVSFEMIVPFLLPPAPYVSNIESVFAGGMSHFFVDNPQFHAVKNESFLLPHDYEQLWEKFVAKHICAPIHDSKFMTWRYASNPILKYSSIEMRHSSTSQLEAFLVYRTDYIEEVELYILRITDCIYIDEIVLQMLIAYVYQLAVSIGVIFIEILVASDGVAQIFKKLGYIDPKNAFDNRLARFYHPIRHAEPKEVFLSVKFNEAHSLQDQKITELENWYISLSVSDLDRGQR